MVRCSFNHWLGWMSSTTKWPPWRRWELLALIETALPLHLCMHSPPSFNRLDQLLYRSDGLLSRLILTLAHLLRGKMLSRNLPSMNAGPLFSNYNAFRSFNRHAWLYKTTFECVNNGDFLEAAMKPNRIVWEVLCLFAFSLKVHPSNVK